MNTYSFRKDLLAVQEELLRFAYKLTADREEANDKKHLLRLWTTKTSLNPIQISEVGCTPLCVISLLIIIGK